MRSSARTGRRAPAPPCRAPAAPASEIRVAAERQRQEGTAHPLCWRRGDSTVTAALPGGGCGQHAKAGTKVALPHDLAPKFRDYARPEMLVTTGWVADHLGDPGLVVAESDEDVLLYETGHILGAIKLDWHTELNDPVTRDYVDGAGFAGGCWTAARRSCSTPLASALAAQGCLRP
jgi:hypothetical protein